MGACAALFLAAPAMLLAPYAAGADPAAFAGVAALSAVLLRFVAFYSVFDTLNVIFAAALKGAGDTVFPVAAASGLSWVLMVLPAWFLCVRGGLGVLVAWSTATAYVVAIGILMTARFRKGEWKSMRVIEPRWSPTSDDTFQTSRDH
jgi:multidrug resistance protein, MATE family